MPWPPTRCGRPRHAPQLPVEAPAVRVVAARPGVGCGRSGRARAAQPLVGPAAAVPQVSPALAVEAAGDGLGGITRLRWGHRVDVGGHPAPGIEPDPRCRSGRGQHCLSHAADRRSGERVAAAGTVDRHPRPGEGGLEHRPVDPTGQLVDGGDALGLGGPSIGEHGDGPAGAIGAVDPAHGVEAPPAALRRSESVLLPDRPPGGTPADAPHRCSGTTLERKKRASARIAAPSGPALPVHTCRIRCTWSAALLEVRPQVGDAWTVSVMPNSASRASIAGAPPRDDHNWVVGGLAL